MGNAPCFTAEGVKKIFLDEIFRVWQELPRHGSRDTATSARTKTATGKLTPGNASRIALASRPLRSTRIYENENGPTLRVWSADPQAVSSVLMLSNNKN